MASTQEQQKQLGNKIVDFYGFVEQALQIIGHGASPGALSTDVKKAIEIPVENESPDIKFDSAIHGDIATIENLMPLFATYEPDRLLEFQKMTEVEIAGLEGDMSLKVILMNTFFGALFTGFVMMVFWFSLWNNLHIIPEGRAFLDKLRGWVEGIPVIDMILFVFVFLGGTIGVGIYVYVTFKNNRQAAHLRSINRALFFLVSNENTNH